MEYLQEVKDKWTGKTGVIVGVRLGVNEFEYDVVFKGARHWLPGRKLKRD